MWPVLLPAGRKLHSHAQHKRTSHSTLLLAGAALQLLEMVALHPAHMPGFCALQTAPEEQAPSAAGTVGARAGTGSVKPGRTRRSYHWRLFEVPDSGGGLGLLCKHLSSQEPCMQAHRSFAVRKRATACHPWWCRALAVTHASACQGAVAQRMHSVSVLLAC